MTVDESNYLSVALNIFTLIHWPRALGCADPFESLPEEDARRYLPDHNHGCGIERTTCIVLLFLFSIATRISMNKYESISRRDFARGSRRASNSHQSVSFTSEAGWKRAEFRGFGGMRYGASIPDIRSQNMTNTYNRTMNCFLSRSFDIGAVV